MTSILNPITVGKISGRTIRIAALCAVIGAFLSLSACISPHAHLSDMSAPPAVVQSEARFRKEYLLAAGDQIEVIVRRVPEVSHVLMIRPDGYITLPLIDDVKAEGLTSQELKAKLTELFSKRLADPEVTVIASQVRQPVVYVAGEVTNTAAIPLRNALTAMDAISLAGGPRRSAATRDVTIIRLTEDGHIRAIPVAAPVGGQPGPLIALRTTLLQADDVIFVPENGRSQVSRFLDDIVNKPLTTVNSLVSTYANFRIVQVLTGR